MAGPGPKRATYADVEAAPEHLVAEIIGGELVTHPRPSLRHSAAAMGLSRALSGPYQYDGDGPGGWIFLIEPEVLIGDDLLVPDLAAWRASRFIMPDRTNYCTVTPDWVCEILSSSTERRDRTSKMAAYASSGVGFFWIVDPRQQIIEVFQNANGVWMKAADFKSDDVVSAAPFDAISFRATSLWALDRPLGLHEAPQPLYAGDR